MTDPLVHPLYQPDLAAPYVAAVVQAAPIAFDPAETIAKVADLCADVARRKATLALFPEAFIPAYPRGLDFGALIGSRTPEGREQFQRYWESAIAVPGPAVARLGGIAKDHGLHLVVGVIERDGGTLYCSVIFLAPDGTYLGKHRKLMPTALERLVWGYGDGSTLPVLPTACGRLGAVICWENYMPLLRAAMYGQGVEVYCAPTADGRETWLPTMRHIAMEGRCFVLSANQYCRRRDYPADYPTRLGNAPDDVYSEGGSCIVDPLGQVLAGPDFSGETILTAEIDLRAIARAKFDFDAVGHYARPDVLRLIVNTAAQPPVQFVEERPLRRTIATD